MPEPTYLSLLELAQAAAAAIRSGLWLVALCLVAVPGAAYALNQTADDRYEASVHVAHIPPTENTSLSRLGITGDAAPTGAQFVGDASVAGIIRRLGLDTPRSQLRERLLVDQPAGSSQATLTAKADSGPQATKLADAWATVVVESRNAGLSRKFRAARRVLRARQQRSPEPAERQIIQVRLLQLATAGETLASDLQVTQNAPRGVLVERFSMGLALGLGLLAGLGLALAKPLVSRRVLTPAVAASNFALPLLGVVGPLTRSGRRGKSTGRGRPLDGEALQSAVRLQSRLALIVETTSPILVTPARQHALHSQIVECAAAAYADGGRATALVRWRTDGLHSFDPTMLPESLEIVEEPGRWPALESRLRRLENSHDVVLIDGPGVLDSGDALLASQHLPIWLLTAGVGDTRADEANSLRHERAAFRQQPIGLAVGEAEKRLRIPWRRRR